MTQIWRINTDFYKVLKKPIRFKDNKVEDKKIRIICFIRVIRVSISPQGPFLFRFIIFHDICAISYK